MYGKVVDIFLINNEYAVTVCYGDYKFIKQVFKDTHHPKPKKLKKLLKNNRGLTYFADKAYPIIILPKYPSTPEEVGILAHEAVHAVDGIYRQIDEKEGRDEVFAHCVAAIVRETILKLK